MLNKEELSKRVTRILASHTYMAYSSDPEKSIHSFYREEMAIRAYKYDRLFKALVDQQISLIMNAVTEVEKENEKIQDSIF